MKKFILLLFSVIIIFSLTGCGSPSFRETKLGDIVEFGEYANEPIKWKCIAVNNNRKLLLSEYAIEALPYNTNYTNITWEHCSLRQWLNTKFYNVAFDENDKVLILTTTNDNFKLQKFDNIGGNDTKDRVFCLSLREYTEYLRNDSDCICLATSHAKKNGALCDTWFSQYKLNCTWWLRTTGEMQDAAIIIFGAPEAGVPAGGAFKIGRIVDAKQAVRPAIWVKGE